MERIESNVSSQIPGVDHSSSQTTFSQNSRRTDIDEEKKEQDTKVSTNLKKEEIKVSTTTVIYDEKQGEEVKDEDEEDYPSPPTSSIRGISESYTRSYSKYKEKDKDNLSEKESLSNFDLGNSNFYSDKNTIIDSNTQTLSLDKISLDLAGNSSATTHNVENKKIFSHLVAAPLVYINPSNEEIIPIDDIDYRRERDLLNRAINSSNIQNLTWRSEIATGSNFVKAASESYVLHYTGHGLEGSVSFENEEGTMGLLNSKQLQQMLNVNHSQPKVDRNSTTSSGGDHSGQHNHTHIFQTSFGFTFTSFTNSASSSINKCQTCAYSGPRLIFISACYSESVVKAFTTSCQVPHIVAISDREKVLDQASQHFSHTFYRALFSGQSVRASFMLAVARVDMDDTATDESKESRITNNNMILNNTQTKQSYKKNEASKFLLLGSGDHNEVLYPPQQNFTKYHFLSQNSIDNSLHEDYQNQQHGSDIVDLSPILPPTHCDAVCDHFIGRHIIVQQIYQHLVKQSTRLLSITGQHGIGKTEVALKVAGYAHERSQFKEFLHIKLDDVFLKAKQRILKYESEKTSRSNNQEDSYNLEMEIENQNLTYREAFAICFRYNHSTIIDVGQHVNMDQETLSNHNEYPGSMIRTRSISCNSNISTNYNTSVYNSNNLKGEEIDEQELVEWIRKQCYETNGTPTPHLGNMGSWGNQEARYILVLDGIPDEEDLELKELRRNKSSQMGKDKQQESMMRLDLSYFRAFLSHLFRRVPSLTVLATTTNRNGVSLLEDTGVGEKIIPLSGINNVSAAHVFLRRAPRGISVEEMIHNYQSESNLDNFTTNTSTFDDERKVETNTEKSIVDSKEENREIGDASDGKEVDCKDDKVDVNRNSTIGKLGLPAFDYLINAVSQLQGKGNKIYTDMTQGNQSYKDNFDDPLMIFARSPLITALEGSPRSICRFVEHLIDKDLIEDEEEIMTKLIPGIVEESRQGKNREELIKYSRGMSTFLPCSPQLTLTSYSLPLSKLFSSSLSLSRSDFNHSLFPPETSSTNGIAFESSTLSPHNILQDRGPIVEDVAPPSPPRFTQNHSGSSTNNLTVSVPKYNFPQGINNGGIRGTTISRMNHFPNQHISGVFSRERIDSLSNSNTSLATSISSVSMGQSYSHSNTHRNNPNYLQSSLNGDDNGMSVSNGGQQDFFLSPQRSPTNHSRMWSMSQEGINHSANFSSSTATTPLSSPSNGINRGGNIQRNFFYTHLASTLWARACDLANESNDLTNVLPWSIIGQCLSEYFETNLHALVIKNYHQGNNINGRRDGIRLLKQQDWDFIGKSHKIWATPAPSDLTMFQDNRRGKGKTTKREGNGIILDEEPFIFPAISSQLSRSKFPVLVKWFSNTMQCLLLNSEVWNRTLPCIIMGFVPHEEVVRLLLDIDRKHRYAIRKGTFIIRVSESRPGCLVITYKVRDNSNELNSVQVEVLEDGGVTLEVRSGLIKYTNLQELLIKVPVLTTLYPNFSVKKLFQ